MNKEFETVINDVVRRMLEYQRDNAVKRKCVDNAQIVYDFITNNFPEIDCKIQCCIVVYWEKDTNILKTVIGHHRVVINNEWFVDPSYETYEMTDCSYFTTFKEFSLCTKGLVDPTIDYKPMLKERLPEFLGHLKIAERINKGEFVITDRRYYNKVCDLLSNRC